MGRFGFRYDKKFYTKTDTLEYVILDQWVFIWFGFVFSCHIKAAEKPSYCIAYVNYWLHFLKYSFKILCRCVKQDKSFSELLSEWISWTHWSVLVFLVICTVLIELHGHVIKHTALVNNSPQVDIWASTEESSGSFLASSSVKAFCSHAAEHSAHSSQFSERLGQKVWTSPRWGGHRFVQGLRQIWLCHRGSCCRDGLFLALCSSEWELLPVVHGESFHC